MRRTWAPRRDVLHRLYKATAPDGRAYIGCTNQAVEQRWRGHVSAAHGVYTHVFKPGSLQAAIVEFGGDQFLVEELETVDGRSDAFQRERDLIIRHRTLAPHGFNRRMSRGRRARDIIDLHASRKTAA